MRGYDPSVRSYYPISLMLEDRRCIVVGGGSVAAGKVRALVACGARVTVVSPRCVASLGRMAQGGCIAIRHRAVRASDLRGAALVIAASDDRLVNASVGRWAQRLSIWVNVVDDPALCTAIAPAVVRRGLLTIAISTSGASPALAQRIRRELGRRYGREYEAYVRLLLEARARIQKVVPEPGRRRVLAHRLLGLGGVGEIRRGHVANLRQWMRALIQSHVTERGRPVRRGCAAGSGERRGVFGAPNQIPQGRAEPRRKPRKARGGRRSSSASYVDDEQRRTAPRIGSARRVAAAAGHLRRRASSAYRYCWYAVVVASWSWPAGACNAAPVGIRLGAPGIRIHTGLALASYAAFLLACVSAVVYLWQERKLKRKDPRLIQQSAPSLEALDRLNYMAVVVGFVFFTVGVGLGLRLAIGAWDRVWDAKLLSAGTTWVLYAVLVYVRATSTLRGRRVALLSVLGFLLVVFFFVGVTFVLPSRHAYF